MKITLLNLPDISGMTEATQDWMIAEEQRWLLKYVDVRALPFTMMNHDYLDLWKDAAPRAPGWFKVGFTKIIIVQSVLNPE